MKKVIFRCLALAIVLGLAILLSASFGAREMRGQSRFPWPARTLPAQGLVSAQGPVSTSSSPLWARSYGLFYGGPAFTDFEEDNAVAVQSIGNGRFVVAGNARSDSYNNQGYPYQEFAIMELGPSGDVKWHNLYPCDPNSRPSVELDALTQSPNGGLLAVGVEFGSDIHTPWTPWVMDVNQDGSVCWMNHYWSGHQATADAVVRTRDGGYAVAGRVYGQTYGICVFKLDQSGGVVWSNFFSFPADDEAIAYSVAGIQETSDGGLVVAGTNAFGKVWSWVIKLNDSGGLVWRTSLSSGAATDYYYTAVNSIVATSDGGVALAGTTGPSHYTTWACKLNSVGNVLWSKTYNGQYAYSIIQTSDGGFLMTGGWSFARAFKLSPSGDVQWAKKYGRSLKTIGMLGACEKDDGGYIMVSLCSSINLTPNFIYTPWVVMSVDKNGDIAPGCPFVRSMTGDARNVSTQIISDSFTMASLNFQVSTSTFGNYTWAPVRVGHNVCSK